MFFHQNSNLLVCFRTSTTLRFTIPESSRSWRTYRVATPLFLTTCRKKSGVCWGVTGSLCVQGWVRVTVRGTGRACCTGTLSWLQQPSIKVGLMLKQEVEAGCSEFLHIVGRRAEIQHVKVFLFNVSEMYGNADRSVPATFEILYMIGWKPHHSQVTTVDRSTAGATGGFLSFEILFKCVFRLKRPSEAQPRHHLGTCPRSADQQQQTTERL